MQMNSPTPPYTIIADKILVLYEWGALPQDEATHIYNNEYKIELTLTYHALQT